MKKHYVRVVRNGRTVTDALIQAPTESGALKLALAGEDIDLGPVKPDEHYTVQCGDAMASVFGDEFESVARYAGDDVPRHDDGAFLEPKPKVGLSYVPEETFGVPGRDFLAPHVYPHDCKHKFDNDVDLYGNPDGIVQRAIDHVRRQMAEQEEAFVRAGISNGAIPLDERTRKIAEQYGAGISNVPRQPIVTPMVTTIEFDFECDCGHIDHYTVQGAQSPNMIYYTSVTCNACGKTHPMRFEQ